jgi:hypothetical protein
MSDVDFLVAILFGMAIIAFFSWDQFKRPSYERSRDFQRVIELLTPPDLRRTTVYFRSYVFYVVMLWGIYLLLCLFVPVGIQAGLGIINPQRPDAASVQGEVGAQELPVGWSQDELGPDAGDDDRDRGPELPLFIALAIVGLAPTIPFLQRFEVRVRLIAHRLSGIPTRLYSGTESLRGEELSFGEAETGYLIPLKDWKRISHYASVADSAEVDDIRAFQSDLRKIFAFESWFVKGKLDLANYELRPGMSSLRADLAERIERFILTVDALSGFTPEVEAAEDPDVSHLVTQGSTEAWNRYATEAHELAFDACVLVVLYVEHRIVKAPDATSNGNGPASDNEQDPEQVRANAVLMQFLSDTPRRIEEGSVDTVIWWRATCWVVAVAFVWGALFGDNPVQDSDESYFGDGFLLGVGYMISALVTYSVAILVAVSWHQTENDRGNWPNAFRSDWTDTSGPIFTIFLVSGFAALICNVAYNLYSISKAVDFQTLLDNWDRVLVSAIAYEGPRAMLAPILAIAIILAIDAWRAGYRISLLLTMITGATTFLWGIVARVLATQVAQRANAGGFFDTLTSNWLENGWPRADFWKDPYIAAGILACLTGVMTMIVVQRTLFRRSDEESELSASNTQTSMPVAGAR